MDFNVRQTNTNSYFPDLFDGIFASDDKSFESFEVIGDASIVIDQEVDYEVIVTLGFDSGVEQVFFDQIVDYIRVKWISNGACVDT